MAFMKVYLFVAVFAVLNGKTKGFCLSNDDCYGSKGCCTPMHSCRESCMNLTCVVNANCGGNSYCCNDICRESCVGYACGDNLNCGAPNEYCCYDTCQKGKCLPRWEIVYIVMASIGIAVVAGIVLYFYRSHRRRIRRSQSSHGNQS